MSEVFDSERWWGCTSYLSQTSTSVLANVAFDRIVDGRLFWSGSNLCKIATAWKWQLRLSSFTIQLYSLLFDKCSSELQGLTTSYMCEALSSAVKTLQLYGGAEPGDRTMVRKICKRSFENNSLFLASFTRAAGFTECGRDISWGERSIERKRWRCDKQIKTSIDFIQCS